MKVGVHIERLVLEGVSARHPARLQGALQQELARLLKHHLPAELPRGGSVASLPHGSVRVAASEDSAVLGARVAHAVHGSLGARR
jgi:hypothetical protein